MSGVPPVTVIVSATVANFKIIGYVERLADADDDALVFNFGETLKLGGQVVRADRQRREAVDARAVRDFRTGESRCGVLASDRHAGHDGALGIDDSAGDGSRGLLRPRRRRRGRQCAEDDHQRDNLFHAFSGLQLREEKTERLARPAPQLATTAPDDLGRMTCSTRLKALICM